MSLDRDAMSDERDGDGTKRATATSVTHVNLAADLARLRAQAVVAVPLLNDDDTIEIDVTAVSSDAERRARSVAVSPEVDSTMPLPAEWRASLEVVGGPVLGRSFDLSTVVMNVGRAVTTLRIDDARMSRVHATFRFVDGVFHVRDAGSANGTYLNGARVSDYPLRDGDTLLMGETTLVFCAFRRR
jgi:hypothetical protein